MTRAKSKRGWKIPSNLFDGVPQGIEARVHKEALRLLPAGLSVDEKPQKAGAIKHRFFRVLNGLVRLNAGSSGPTPKQSKAALQALKKDADRLVKRLEELDELTAAILMLSKKPRVLDEQVELSLRVHFEGVWTLVEALPHALRQAEAAPGRRTFSVPITSVPLDVYTATHTPRADYFVGGLKRLLFEILKVTGALPSVSWDPFKGKYTGPLLPLSKLLAEAAYPSRRQKDNSWPGSAARKAYRSVKRDVNALAKLHTTPKASRGT